MRCIHLYMYDLRGLHILHLRELPQPYTANTGIPVDQSSIALLGVNQGSINQWETNLLDQSINVESMLVRSLT